MKRTRRLVSLLLVTLLLAACSKTPSRRVADTTPQSGLTTIRIGVGSNDVAGRYLDQIIADFQTKFPAYRVEKVAVEERKALREKMEKGEIDLITTYGTEDLAGAADLTPYLQRAGLERGRYGYLLEGSPRATEALPYAVIPYAIFINKGLFEQAGAAVPSPEWTWEEFRTVATRVSAREGDTQRYGFAAGFAEELAAAWLQGKTKRPLAEADERSVQEWLAFFHTMIFTDRAMKPVEPVALNASYSRSSSTDFPTGTLPMAHGPLFSATSLQQYDFPWTYLPLPVHSGGSRVANSHSLWLAASQNSPNLDAAWEFLHFAVTEPGAVALARAGFMPSSWSDATADAWVQGNPGAPEASRIMLRTQWSTGRYPGELGRGLGWSINQVMSGKMTVDEGLAAYRESR